MVLQPEASVMAVALLMVATVSLLTLFALLTVNEVIG